MFYGVGALLMAVIFLGIILSSAQADREKVQDDFDNMWTGYGDSEEERGIIFPTPFWKGLFWFVTQLIMIGYDIGIALGIWAFPLGVLLLLATMVDPYWIIYPFAFIYVVLTDKSQFKFERVEA